jgi:hypothetical protein
LTVKKKLILFLGFFIFAVTIHAQKIKNKNYEFLVPTNYSLINPAFSSTDSSDAGLVYESFFGIRNIYSTSHYYFNYRKNKIVNFGGSFYNESEEDFSNLMYIGLSFTYTILETKKMKIQAAMKPNLWNYVIQGNDFLAGRSYMDFNMDAGIDVKTTNFNITIGINNMMPIEYQPLDNTVLLRKEYNIYLSYTINKMWMIYSHLDYQVDKTENLFGGQFNYKEYLFAYSQWSSTNGFSIGGKTHLKLRPRFIWQLSFFYGLGSSNIRLSQYAIQTGFLF